MDLLEERRAPTTEPIATPRVHPFVLVLGIMALILVVWALVWI